MDSSLILAARDFYSIVSECSDEQGAEGYLLELQECIERRLGNGSVAANSRGRTV